jgi:hypothetical protein
LGRDDQRRSGQPIRARRVGRLEIGTQRETIARKADADYKKRTQDPLQLNAAESTFIWVTPRHWPKKDEWAAQKRSEGKWKDVRAYDGTDLVHWIECFPAVGQWLATYLQRRPPGVQQLEEIWTEWSRATERPLTPQLIMSERDENGAAVLRWLRAPAEALVIQGETVEEVASFLYASIKELPDAIAVHYLARCLVTTTSQAARQLADSVTPMVIVLLDPEAGLAQAMADKGHHVLLAYDGSSGSHVQGQKLRRPLPESIEHALKIAGVEEERARGLARESSRSLAILRRLMPSTPGRLPAWARGAPPRALIAALLAGGWDEESVSDKAMLSRLANMPYDEFIASVMPFVGEFYSPLRKVGTTWKVASPQDASLLLAPYATPAEIDRFAAVFLDVLGTADPRYALDPNERWYASIKGVTPEYSEFLRHGLGQILIMLALLGEKARTVPDTKERANAIVRKLLHEADAERWWSLSQDFQLLAEAAPDTFLEAVQHSLDQENPPIAALFVRDENHFMGTEHLSNLLWALESLAWAPQYLGRAASLLAGLDAQGTRGGRRGNRPASSLRHLFLLWLPQTNATLAQRLRVLDTVARPYPAQVWTILLGILPSGHDAFSPAATTRWRDYSVEATEVIT